jgi:hypothetical protein
MMHSIVVANRDDFTLDQYLCNSQICFMYVNNRSHWVVATAQTTINNVDTYSDINPAPYPSQANTTLLNLANPTYTALDTYSDTSAALHGLYVRAHSPVELDLVDPNGNHTGFNPNGSSQSNGIPQSAYLSITHSNVDNPALPPSVTVKDLVLYGPSSGGYTLNVIGTGSGPFTLDIAGVDQSGNPFTTNVSGTVVPGLEYIYKVGYSSTPGVGTNLTVLSQGTTNVTITQAAVSGIASGTFVATKPVVGYNWTAVSGVKSYTLTINTINKTTGAATLWQKINVFAKPANASTVSASVAGHTLNTKYSYSVSSNP